MAINLNETATLTLKGNTRDFDNELLQLNTKAKELKSNLKEIEQNGGKGSEEWKKYKNELAGVNAETAKVRKEVDLTQLSYGQLKSLVGQLNKDLLKLKPGTDEFVAATKRLADAEKQFKAVGNQVDEIKKSSDELGKPTLWQKIGSGVGTMQKAFQAFMALQIIGYIIDIGKSIFETTSKFEKYGKILETALGSQKQAKSAMEALKKLGSETAFSVDELTEGYVKMVNRGLRPSQKEMVAMTDLAASQGKTFDQLVEAALDAQTGENERLKEFGISAKKSGDEVTFSFKGMNQTVKNTPEAIQGAIIAFGQMNGVAGQNAKMMQTLDGQASNLGDSMDALMVAIGNRLKPVFVWLLSAMSTGVQWLLKLAESTEPVVTVFADLFDAIGALLGSLQPMIQRIFPNMISGGTALKGVMQLVALAFRAVITPVQAGIAIFIAMGQTFGGVLQAARALESFLKGDVVGGKAQWEASKKTFDQVGNTAKANFNAIANGWKTALVDKPKQIEPEAVFAAKETEKKRQSAMTDEQKKAQDKREKEAEKARKKEQKDHEKALEDVQKANEKALELLAKEEAEAHIAGIKDEMQREFAKLQAKRDLEAEDIMRGIQDEKIKNQQIASLDKKLQEDITRVAGEYAEKKRKKAEEEELKKLANEKFIIEQERQAENALFDWRELKAKNNASQLASIHKERVDKQLQLTIDKLNAEENAEKAKAARDATSKEQSEAMITAIEGRYHNERILAEKKHADEVDKINKELQEKKKAVWTNTSNAFGALLKGDLNAFVDYADKIVQGEKSAWQKRLAENQEKYAAVGAMAQQAAQFLADLEKQKADKAIAEAQRERDEKVRLLNDQIAVEKAAQDAAELEKQQVTQESNDKISAIKSETQSAISSLESQYRQLSSSEEKKKLDEQLSSYKDNADEKAATAKQTAQDNIEAAQDEAKQSIEAAQQTEKEAIKSATNEKNEKIDAAEATRDAEITAIKNRKDVDQATRTQLLAEAKAAFDTAKQQAEDEAKDKIEKAKDVAKTQTELAKDTAKTKTELAEDQRDAELKAIEAVQKGDEKAAKEILTKAKEDQKEKIRLAKEEADKKIDEAEREKREKLKKVEAEKQTRIQNQKELNRSIDAENKKAAAAEAEAKRKAWLAQQKADIASALIAGALATIKALASGFWPVNLVFAALSAVMTGVQVAKIKSQPMPQFEHGGFIPSGGRHASTYGKGGIGLIDRQSGQDVGEMEGGEAIISREQTQANMPFIQRMFANARTPGRRHQPVDFRDALGRSSGFADGGLFDSGYWKKDMFLYGGIKRGQTPPRYQEGGISDSYDDGGYSSSDSSSDSSYDDSEARAAQEQAKKQGEEQLKLLNKIADNVEKAALDNRAALSTLEANLRSSINQAQQNQSLAIALQNLRILTGLESVQTAINTGSTSISNMTKSGFDTLNRTLTLVMLRTSITQSSDTDRLIAELRAGVNNLGTSLTTAIGESSNKTVQAINLNRLTNQLQLSSLALTMVAKFDRLISDSHADLSLLTKTTSTGLEKLYNQSRNDFDELAYRLENSQSESARRISTSINNASLTNQLALASLALKTTTSLETLNRDQKLALGKLSNEVVDALDTLSINTERVLTLLNRNVTTSVDNSAKSTRQALQKLSDDITGSVEVLNKEQKQALGSLGDKTEAALKDSTNRTTRSIDSNSGEVRSLKGSINAVEGAVWQVRGAVNGVEGAVYGTNQAGKLDTLIASISTFGGKK